MPKILENVREQLLAEAKKQINENGYAKTTIRSVAGACGLATGTVYNYFSSKDMLIATFMLEEWKVCLNDIKSGTCDDAETFLSHAYGALQDYVEKHRKLFDDNDAAKPFAAISGQRHKQLCSQIALVIEPVCRTSSVDDKEFLAGFIAEALLNGAMSGTPFDKLYSVLGLLLTS
jgi:AcrR family transcriptional regulator